MGIGIGIGIEVGVGQHATSAVEQTEQRLSPEAQQNLEIRDTGQRARLATGRGSGGGRGGG